MSSYAILGGTGKTGRCLLSILLESPENTINVYVRSRSRLLALFPSLSDNKRVAIFSGAIDDIALLSSCISGVNAVFATVATNENVPGLRIAQDQSQSIVAAFCHLRTQDPATKLPRVLILSASMINPTLVAHLPSHVVWVVRHAVSHVYADLEHAERFLRLHKSWLDVVFVQPGALVDGERRGHELSLELEISFLSYADMAAGMIEIADSVKYSWQGLSVNPKQEGAMGWLLPFSMAKGLLFHFIPPSYGVAKQLGLV
ncbi:MAG: hypothetical protein LQ347_001975 [Umbilicaria vellea]|nr:MAG: hypothetical protein LQ347_001975 [Umbilicaria vellea]